jgi:transcriptional regulator with XRE-family HTH domain
MEFKDRLKKLRQERGISQQALADSIYVSRSAVAKWENGLGIPNKTSYESLLEYFNLTEKEFPLNEEMESVSVSKNHKIRRLSKAVIALSLCLVFVFSVIATDFIITLSYFKDSPRIGEIEDAFNKEIFRSEPGKFSGMRYFAIGLTVNDVVDLFYEEEYDKTFGEDFLLPQEGRFRAHDGEVFTVEIGVCTMHDYIDFVAFSFNIRIFNRLGYLIEEKRVDLTCYKNGKIDNIDIDGIAKYWHAMQTPISELKNT